MKKVFFLGLAVVGLTMVSCKKDYTCACTADDSFWDISYTAELKKKDAESWCDSWDASGVGIDGWKCELQ